MPKRIANKDLFGNRQRERRPRYEASLAVSDRQTLPEQAARVRWLSSVIPKALTLGVSIETAIVLEETKRSFVDGNFVSVVVLSAAFMEHWFVGKLTARGYHKEAEQGLGASIKCARANKLVDPLILEKADRVRLIRNPFVHLKDYDHEFTVAQRMMDEAISARDCLDAGERREGRYHRNVCCCDISVWRKVETDEAPRFSPGFSLAVASLIKVSCRPKSFQRPQRGRARYLD